MPAKPKTKPSRELLLGDLREYDPQSQNASAKRLVPDIPAPHPTNIAFPP